LLPKEIKHVYFIGIGGYGMSALAAILLQMGYRVSGSDLKNSRIIERLQARGAKIYLKHQPQNVNNCDLAVYSTAIPEDNPELMEASRCAPLWHRSHLLAAMLNSQYGIAVTGTHGKTTTTAMLTLLLENGGIDPTAIIGGEVNIFDGNARLGNSKYLVAEACESDNSFLRYCPYLTVITNVEPEHLEYYDGSFAKLKEAYLKFMYNTKSNGSLILNAEDPFLREVKSIIPKDIVTYAIEGSPGERCAQLIARQLQTYQQGTRFCLYINNHFQGQIELTFPGKHNVSNALAALATVWKMGLNPIDCAEVLSQFKGVGRRFEVVGQASEVTVVDDYAHHPTEIKATLQAARSLCSARGGKVIALFQPHRYSRTSYFMNEFAESFGDADIVLLHSVYAAGEKPIKETDSSYLYEMIKEKGKTIYYLENMTKLAEIAVKLASPGDIIITLGAGDICKAANIALHLLSV